jgi:hypothetical protein
MDDEGEMVYPRFAPSAVEDAAGLSLTRFFNGKPRHVRSKKWMKFK